MPTQSPEWIAASRLVRRTGFGSTGTVVDAVVQQGAGSWLAAAMAADPAADAGSTATPPPELTAKANPAVREDKAAKQELNTQIREDRRELVSWWLRRMVSATEPLHERLTFAWHDHFATGVNKVRFPALMLAQNEKLRSMGRGDFRTLTLEMLADAAMLRWLDGTKNTAKAPNENLGRELLELFTLGEGGGYTEDDVKQAARALTGWVIEADGTTRVVAKRHDKKSKTVLGVTGNLDTEQLCDAILARPETAQHVTTRLWKHLVSPDAPDEAVADELVSAWGETGDLGAVLTRMLGGPELAEAEGSHIVSPLEWAVGAARSLGTPMETDQAVNRFRSDLRSLGQVPFYPPSVAGWPSGQAWLSTAATTQRVTTATRLVADGDISSVAQAGSDDRLDATAYLLGIGGWSDRTATALRPLAGKPPQLVAMALNTPEYLVH